MTSRWALRVVYLILVCIECIHAVFFGTRSLLATAYQRVFGFFNLEKPPLQYQYYRLDSSRTQIRLLKVLHRDGKIGIDLCTFDFATAPDFIALSYTWGEPEPSYSLFLGNKYIVIRENLHQFLQRYRRNQFLWIDQICIDQSQIAERNSQVRLMSEIYRRCEFVLVWLDSISPSHSTVEEMLRNKHFVVDLLQHRYFTRLWVIQEVLLAPKVRVRLQDVWIEWHDLREAVERWTNIGHGLTLSFSTLALIGMRNIQPYTLENCVETFSRQGCEDVRDKVYDLLGLVNEEERISIDYAKSAHQVYCDVVIAFCSRYTVYTDALRESGVDVRASEQHLVKLREYVISLLVLSDEMGFSKNERNALKLLLKEVWTPDTFVGTKTPANPVTCPITAMGYDPGRVSGSYDGTSGRLLMGRHCWWYRKCGQIYYYDC